jgi:hypothetical protein
LALAGGNEDVCDLILAGHLLGTRRLSLDDEARSLHSELKIRYDLAIREYQKELLLRTLTRHALADLRGFDQRCGARPSAHPMASTAPRRCAACGRTSRATSITTGDSRRCSTWSTTTTQR